MTKKKNYVLAPRDECSTKYSSTGIDLSKKKSKTKNFQDSNLAKRRKINTNDIDDDDTKNSKYLKNLFKQPTVEEISQLKETENLFHSNLFRLQIEELIKGIRIKEKHQEYIEKWILKFNIFLKNLTSMEDKCEPYKSMWFKKTKIKIPFDLDNIKKKKFSFQFLKPDVDAILIGSYNFEAVIDTKFTVDIMITMPKNYFQKDNYLNLIYDQKRALYLMYIAEQLLKTDNINGNIKFNYYNNNPLKPIIEIIPNDNFGNKLKFRIFVAPMQDSFKLNRFIPWNSNIRYDLFDDISISNNEQIPLATPNYNANILFDLTMETNQQIAYDIFSNHKNLREGLILLKIWLKQRSLDLGYSGFSGHIMTMYVVYLFKERKIHTSMSSYQIARSVWNNLASSSWDKENNGITLCKNTESINQPTLEQFHVYYEIVFIDFTGYLNICANLALGIYKRVQLEAKAAISILNDKSVNSFQLLFMTKVPLITQFDHILRFPSYQLIKKILTKYRKVADLHNYAGFWYPQILKLITEVLSKGLNDRILLISPIEDISVCRNLTESNIKDQLSLTLGILLNDDKAYEVLDKGPQANEIQAEEFRNFWGTKSELRRFKDGTITESCVWCPSNANLSEKRIITKKIIYHLLEHHFSINENEIFYIAEQFDMTFQLNPVFYLFENVFENAENTALSVIKSFNELGQLLRNLNDIPLDITAVQGISSVFRYCDPIPIMPNGRTFKDNNKTIFQSYKISEGVIQLGISGKWPKELKAFRRVKTAFHIKIANLLRTQYKLETRGGIDGIHILKDGYIFKIEIANQKEIALIKELKTANIVKQLKDTEDSFYMEKRFILLPKLNSALHSLYQKFPCFGPSVMISKRWLYSQMIDNYLWPDECTELLIAYNFLKTGNISKVLQPQTIFFGFLQFLAIAKWKNDIFILNFNDDMSGEDISQLENSFNKNREEFPPLSIITSYDFQKNGIWTKNAPCEELLERVSYLAQQTFNIIEKRIFSNNLFDIRDLFIASLEGYDVIINLRANLIHTCLAYEFEAKPKLDIKVDATIPAADFDPVQYCLHELREAYNDFAIFFYNPCGGKEIAVIWKPDTFEEKDFKVTSIKGRELLENGKLRCNIERFIEDFKIITRGLYLTIDNQRLKNNTS